jgi:hypothetical protein
MYPSAEYRLPASLDFAESDAIGGVVSLKNGQTLVSCRCVASWLAR